MIEFNCSGCQTLLRLPDDMGGLRGKCTKCGEILQIPTATEHYWPPGAKASAPAASLSGVRAAQTTATNSAIARSRAGQAASPAGKPSAPPNNPADTVVYSVSDTVVVATSKSASSKSSPGNGAARPVAPGNSGVLDAASSIQPSSSSIFSASGVIPIAPGPLAPGNSNVLNGNSSIGRAAPAGASGLASGKSSVVRSVAPGKSSVQNSKTETARPAAAGNSSVSSGSAQVARPAGSGNSGILTGNGSISRAVVPGTSGISKSGAARPVPLGPAEDDEHAQKKPAAAANIDVKDVLKRAWGIYRANLGAMIGAAIVFFIVGAAIALATAGILQSMHAPIFVAGLMIQALTIWLTMGALSFAMKTARGRQPGIGELFKQLPLYGPALAVWALFFSPMWAVQGICFALDISSGPASLLQFLGSTLISWFLWLPAQLAIVDGQIAAKVPLHSLRYAGRNFTALSALYLIAGAVIMVSLLPVLLGFPLALPFVAVLATVAYLRDGRAR
ncbi:MAG TPA: hypothetical protein VL175_19880 [Pirellulales bacterium]|jgi:hypothetical protein|nr:hypothetical protein [Pirellulales bacterium]